MIEKKRLTKRYLLQLLTLSLILILVCTSCSGSDFDEAAFLNAVDTAVAATDAAQVQDDQKTVVAETLNAPSDTPAPTFTTVPNSPTPEPSITPTPENTGEAQEGTQASISPSLSGPAVQVSVDTNCRSGPGKSYTWLGALMVGEQATITGKDPSGAYWYITNPMVDGGYCWIWGYYATIGGNTSVLPIFTLGPTPTPDPNFSTAFHQVESCGGAWQVEFTIVNNGFVPLESISSTVKDTVTGNSSGKSSRNQFIEKNGCADLSSYGRLQPEDIGYTVSLDLPTDPTGNLVYASLRVCTEDNMFGDCRTREFYFTP